MKRCFVVLAIVFSLAVMAAQPGYGSLTRTGLAGMHGTGVLPIKALGPIPYTTSIALPEGRGSFLVAEDIDLRDVDWDKVKVGKNGGGDGKDSVNGDKGGNGDDGEDDEKDEETQGEKEEEEEGGGWDRTWDAPRLG
jgi:hypothetical protein